MADSDALLIVEDWISEHYFTTDADRESFRARVLARAKQWKSADGQTTESRFTEARSRLAADLAALYSDDDPSAAAAGAIHAELLRILGYVPGPYETEVSGPVRWLRSPSLPTTLAVVAARPAAALEDLFAKDAPTLAEPFVTDSLDEIVSASRLVSHLFLADDQVRFALILAGRWLVVAEASRWPEGRYLAVDIQTVAERGDARRGGEIQRALTALDAESLAPDAEGDIWWDGVLEESVRHTVGVSADLREGVRTSIEIIANEVVDRRRARGLAPIPAADAQPLALQSLRFLYRILFLLYAEASPQLRILPVGDPDYARGYSLDRLRELIQVELTSTSLQGTHLYESLGVLFRLVNHGHSPRGDGGIQRGLEFQGLRADLFQPGATALIDEVGLGNGALQEVLRRLLLSRERAGRERGFISYVELGINQLGAVYEGLMSYTGSFATEDLYEVAPDGNPEKGSWVVPVRRCEHLREGDFVTDSDPVTGQRTRRRYGRGQFVFRLSGRERQRSASYYTPEVLTRFTVSQALAELLGDDLPAERILSLTVCEPALGSGAFAIEATRQLAEEYLRRRQGELGVRIDPDDYAAELQRVKAYIALHNVYGVDLNATAVEFAEITLWLDTMAPGLAAPWFGLRLRRGNSLAGASRACYTRAQVNDRTWLTTPPAAVPLTDIAERVAQNRQELSGVDGRIHHWLLPAAGWGATAESKEAKALVPEQVKRLKAWRRGLKTKPSKQQLNKLVAIAHQADELWALAYRRLHVAEQESARDIPLFGREPSGHGSRVTREQIEQSLADENGAYRRLRRMMDAWCALWFWPLTGREVEPPTLGQWITAAEGILGAERPAREKHALPGQEQLTPTDAWTALADQEDFVLISGSARPVEEVLEEHPWLKVCEQVAARQGFFHWQLDFATVFGRGGFDLQVGNPPWVRPDVDIEALLAEGDPWWQLALKPSEATKREKRAESLALPGVADSVLDGENEIIALREFVSDITTYPILSGLRPDLYRCFMARTWENASTKGIVGLLHPETHFTDEKAAFLREETYKRLRRHWQFVNELQYFSEIDHHNTFGVHIYGASEKVSFIHASGLYNPDTVERSFRHDGSGEEPGAKYEGQWDQRPHAARLQQVSTETLKIWRDLLEPPDSPASRARMLYTVNRTAARVLAKLGTAPRTGSLGLEFSAGWNEKTDRVKGRFIQEWGRVNSWDDAILQGPHLHVANPAFKSPNSTMKHNQDWSPIDLETLAPDALPVTAYKPAGSREEYDTRYGDWKTGPVRDRYRVAWRRMAANSGEHTLITAMLPPGPTHVNAVHTVGGVPLQRLVLLLGVTHSLIADFAIRSVPKGDVYLSALERLPLPPLDHSLLPRLLLRTLRLNCLTDAYADVWEEVWDPVFAEDEWLLPPGYEGAPRMGDVGSRWTPATPLRRDIDRRNALVEIDALMATMLGVTADELCTIYRTQFAVLHGYDQTSYIFDANGRIVPNPVLVTWRKKDDRITQEERTHPHPGGKTYTYDLPCAPRNRETDFRTAITALRSKQKGH